MSHVEWLSTVDSFIDLPPGSQVNECLYHCLYEELFCDVAVFENGRCHFGEWGTSAQSSVTNLKNTTGPWTIYFSAKYAQHYISKYQYVAALNTSINKVSAHFFMRSITNMEVVCLLNCNFHAQNSRPCTFYVFINATNECFIADIGTSKPVNIGVRNDVVLVQSLQGMFKFDSNQRRSLTVFLSYLLDTQTPLGDHFEPILPVKGYHINRFLYKRTFSNNVCRLTCYLDPDSRCSFFLIDSGICYFGDVFQTLSNTPPPNVSPIKSLEVNINTGKFIKNKFLKFRQVSIGTSDVCFKRLLECRCEKSDT